MLLDNWGVIIEARMNSSRFPQKVMHRFGNLKSIELMIMRLNPLFKNSDILIATTDSIMDNDLVIFIKSLGVNVFRGSELEVFERVVQAANFFGKDKIVSLTADCPLIDFRIIERMCTFFDRNDFDYMTNFMPNSFPDGMEVQLFTNVALQKAATFPVSSKESEHVGLIFRNNLNHFSVFNFMASERERWPNLRLTLDYKEDAELISEILKYFSPGYSFSCSDIIDLIKLQPKLLNINSKLSKIVAR